MQAALSKWQGETFETAAAEAGLVATMMRSRAGVGRPSPGPGRCAAAGAGDQQDRRGPGPPAAPRGRSAALGHPRRRPDARYRRTGVRAHACRPRRRRHAHHRAAPAGPGRARHRYGPRQALRRARPARRRGARTPRRSCCAKPTSSCRATGPADSPSSASRRRPAPRSGPASSPSPCRPTAMPGPWATRHGFDSLVQTASGLNHAEAEAAGVLPRPKELPAQALDHASGYLMAFGAMMALARKAREGGSWHVRVSLAQTGPLVCRARAPGERPRRPRSQVRRHRRPPAGDRLFPRPPHLRAPRRPTLGDAGLWARPPVPLGTHAPVWPV